jgi:hypothetical protein
MKQDKKHCLRCLNRARYHLLGKGHLQLISDLNENRTTASFIVNTKRKIAKIGFFSAIFVLNNLNIASATLSSTTAKTIQGHKPKFIAHEAIIDKLGFSYKGVDYNGNKISSNTTKYFDDKTKLSDFIIKSYFTPDDYTDADGDVFDPEPVTSTLNHVWKDSRGKVIEEDDYNDIACNFNKYTMPLQLEITATDIKVKTKYGDPNESDPVSKINIGSPEEKPITKTYKIAIAKACFAKPNSVILDPSTQWRSVKNDSSGIDEQWNLTGNGLNNIAKNKPNPEVGGGYTDDYVKDQGFKVEPTVVKDHFPTTGFKGAQFQLVMSGMQQEYEFSSTSDNAPIDGDGIVTLKGPVKNVTITATLKSDRSIYSKYTFDLKLWVEPKDIRVANQAEASSKCVSPMRLLSRKELNDSSKFAKEDLDIHLGRKYNIFTRGIGLGVLAEWGRSLHEQFGGQKPTYPKSTWKYGWYFTNEQHKIPANQDQPITEGIVVSSHDGMISFPSAWGHNEPKWAICGQSL